MSAVKTIGQYDTGVTLSFTIRDTNGNPVNLTGYTVTLAVLVKQNALPLHGTPLLKTVTCTITDAVNGKAQRVTDGTEFTYGNVMYQMQLTATNGTNTYTSTFAEVFVRPVLNNPNSGGVVLWG